MARFQLSEYASEGERTASAPTEGASQAGVCAEDGLAAQLWAVRQKFIASGGKLLGPADVRKEVARRRGEER